jgi:hypothetical protein
LTERVPPGADPSTARVLGVELSEEYRLAYDWLDDSFQPSASETDIATEGGGFTQSKEMSEAVKREVSRGLDASETLPGGYRTGNDLLDEYIARKFTAGRHEYDRVRLFDDEFDEARASLARLQAQDSLEGQQGVLITMGEKLTIVGAFLFQRYKTSAPDAVPAGKLPAYPNARQPKAVIRVLHAYDQALPDAADAAEKYVSPPGQIDGVEEARDSLALAATAIAYARSDEASRQFWPPEIDRYDVTFEERSPESGLKSLPEYDAETLKTDVRAFDTVMERVAERFNEGTYLSQFRQVGTKYIQAIQQMG